MTKSNQSKSSSSRPQSTPPKESRTHIIGALVGAVISLFLPRTREAQTLFSRLPIVPIHGPFGPFYRREQPHLDPSQFGAGLWKAIDRIRDIIQVIGKPPSDETDLENWINSLPIRINANEEETALLNVIPLAIASMTWSDDVLGKLRRHLLDDFRNFYGSKWVVASMWIYFVMLRSALLRKNPIHAGQAEIDQLPDEMQHAFRAILSRGWSPSWDADISCLSMRCVAHVAWIVRSTDKPEVAFLLATDDYRNSQGITPDYGEFRDDDSDSRGIRGAAVMIRILAGALVGAVHGIHRIPSALSTYARIVVGERERYQFPDAHGPSQIGTSSIWDIQNIALELAGFPTVEEATMEPPVGPVNVTEGLFAANLMGALDTPTDWCVVSLCRTGDRFRYHAFRRQIYLIDKEGDINPDLAAVVQDAVDAIDLHLSQGRPVVVHCHGGRSRTGLILKAWKMRKDGIDEQAAHEWLKASWPLVNRSNQTFIDFLRNEWPKVMKDFEND